MSSDTNESAVSEIIGVILVVALTVIMAAIIAAFVFGMVDTMGTPRIISVTVLQTSPSSIAVTYRGGPDQGSLQGLTIIWPDGTQQVVNNPKVGQSWQASGNNVTPLYTDHVVVTARFTNNVDQVVLDTMI
jgi:FlaG/FlaF family flagellin (archaellin)